MLESYFFISFVLSLGAILFGYLSAPRKLLPIMLGLIGLFLIGSIATDQGIQRETDFTITDINSDVSQIQTNVVQLNSIDEPGLFIIAAMAKWFGIFGVGYIIVMLLNDYFGEKKKSD